MRLVLLLLGLTAVLPARAQQAEEIARWTAEAVTAAPGTAATLRFRAVVAPGWKLYALDTPPPSPALHVTVQAPPNWTAGAPAHEVPPEAVYDSILEVTTRVFHGRAGVSVPVQVAISAAPGRFLVPAEVTFTVCNASICLPPKRITLQSAVQITAASEASQQTPTAEPPQTPVAVAPPVTMPDSASVVAAPFSPATPRATLDVAAEAAAMPGIGWSFVLLALGAGLAALLTPCVFPMIPLTVSYFTRHTASRGEALRMAGLFGLTIVGTFTGLGLALALVVGAAGAGRLAAHPGVNLFIGLVFVAFGLSLLGLYEIRLPARFVNQVDAAGRTRGGMAGVVFMGLALTLVSFSCTVPFVGALLAAAARGAWMRPLVGMLVFSATFALPFFAFALFPRALTRFPKSGAWMDVLRVTLGLVELAAALKFLSQADLVWGLGVLTRPVAIALTAVLFGVTGFYLLGLVRLPATEGQTVGPLRLVAAVGFLGAALYLVPGLWGAPLGLFDAYLPPRRAADFTVAGGAAPSAPDEGWYIGTTGLAAARVEAAQTGKPVFVDFSGNSCTNCRYMEAAVFTKPEVAQRFQRDFVLARVYTDDAADGEALQRYQLELTGTVALPTYAILAPDGKTLVALESGVMPAARFASFLDGAAARRVDVAAR